MSGAKGLYWKYRARTPSLTLLQTYPLTSNNSTKASLTVPEKRTDVSGVVTEFLLNPWQEGPIFDLRVEGMEMEMQG